MTYERRGGGSGGGGGLDEAEVQALVDAAVADLVTGAPGALDTLNELAAALGDDANFAASMTTALAGKVPLSLIDAADDLIVGSADNTAARLAVAASRIIGKKATGGIGALTAAEVRAILGITSYIKGFDSFARTAGDQSLNNTSWTDVPNITDLVLPAAAGDRIEVGISSWATGATSYLCLDVATIVSGAPVNYVGATGGAGDFGVQAWLGSISADYAIGGYAPPYTVQAGDISGGNVTLRLRFRTASAAAKTMVSSAAQPFRWWARCFGA